MSSVFLPPPVEGLMPDLDPTMVPPTGLVTAKNFLRRAGQIVTRPGLTTMGSTLGARPMGVAHYNHEEKDGVYVVGTTAGWHLWTASGWSDITGNPLTGGPTAHVIFRAFNTGALSHDGSGRTYLIGVNGANSPKIWDYGDAAYADLGGSPPISNTIAVAADRIILTDGKDTIYVSSTLDPTAGWGDFQLKCGETDGDIVGLREFGALQTMVYKERSVHAMFAQDNALAPFRQEVVRSKISGPVSPNAIFGGPNGVHLYLGTSGELVMYDGAQPQAISDRLQAYLLDNVDWTYAGRSFGWWNPYRNEIWILYPAVGNDGDIDSGVVLTWPDLSIWPVAFAWPVTCGIDATVYAPKTIGELVGPAPDGPTIADMDLGLGELRDLEVTEVLCRETGQVYKQTGTDDGGTDIAVILEPGLSNLGDPTRFDTINDCEWLLNNTAETLQVKLGVSNTGATRTLSAFEKTIVMTAGKRRITRHRTTGLWHTYRLYGSVDEKVIFSGVSVNFTPQGYR